MNKLSIWDEMQRMQDEMDNMFRSLWNIEPYSERKLINGPKSEGPATYLSNYRKPLTDIYETENEVIASLELPGVSKEDIQLNIKDNTLEVKVEKKTEKEDKKKGMYRIERSYSGFYRAFELPSKVIAEKADASYKNGVLEIKMPKNKAESKEVKKIEVK